MSTHTYTEGLYLALCGHWFPAGEHPAHLFVEDGDRTYIICPEMGCKCSSPLDRSIEYSHKRKHHEEMVNALTELRQEQVNEAEALTILLGEELGEGLREVYTKGITEYNAYAEALAYAVEYLTKGERDAG